MLLCLATNPKDYQQACHLAEWMAELTCGYENHWMLLAGSSTLDEGDIGLLGTEFRKVGFRQVVTIRKKEEEKIPWPCAANSMFRLCATWVAENARVPFLWIEADAIPIQHGWLDRLHNEYVTCRKKFMGTLYGRPWNHLNGVAVYPANVRKFNPLIFSDTFYGLPFDTVRADLTLKEAHITNLIWRGLADPASNTPHTFPDAASLSIIPLNACWLTAPKTAR